MRQQNGLLGKWLLLTLASLLAAFLAMFALHAIDGRPLSSAFIASGTMALFSGAIGALVIVGPLLTLWAGWQYLVLGNFGDHVTTVLFFCMPSFAAVSTAAALALTARVLGKELRVWTLTVALAPLLYTGTIQLLARTPPAG